MRIIPTDVECVNDFSSLSQYNNTLHMFLIRVTVLLEYFDLFDNVARALTWGPLTSWGLLCYCNLALGASNTCLTKPVATGHAHYLDVFAIV